MAERVGLPGAVAAVLAGACLAGWLLGVRPSTDEVQRLRSENAVLQDQLTVRAGRLPASVEDTPRQQLAEFSQRFPNERAITSTFARLHRMALHHGLQLQHAEFRLSGDAGDPISRYSMVLPVEGDYRSLRGFVDEVLRDLPSVALDELTLRRDDAKAQVLEARLRLVLFVSRSE